MLGASYTFHRGRSLEPIRHSCSCKLVPWRALATCSTGYRCMYWRSPWYYLAPERYQNLLDGSVQTHVKLTFITSRYTVYLPCHFSGKCSMSSYHDAGSSSRADRGGRGPSVQASPRSITQWNFFPCWHWPWSWSRYHRHHSKPWQYSKIVRGQRMNPCTPRCLYGGSFIRVGLHFLCSPSPFDSYLLS